MNQKPRRVGGRRGVLGSYIRLRTLYARAPTAHLHENGRKKRKRESPLPPPPLFERVGGRRCDIKKELKKKRRERRKIREKKERVAGWGFF